MLCMRPIGIYVCNMQYMGMKWREIVNEKKGKGACKSQSSLDLFQIREMTKGTQARTRATQRLDPRPQLTTERTTKRTPARTRATRRLDPRLQWTLIWLAGYVIAAGAIVAYDCTDTKTGVPFKKLDLTQIEECGDPKRDYDEKEEAVVQILQQEDHMPMEAYRCKGTLSRTIAACGFTSLTYGTIQVNNVDLDLTAAQCREAVRTKKLVIEGKEIHVEPGQRTQLSYFSHGNVDSAGGCTTESFALNSIVYNHHYQQIHLEITLAPVKATLEVGTGRVRLQDGLVGNYKDEVLRDTFEGTLVWKMEDRPCDDTISEVYRGQAELYHFRNATQGETGSIIMVRNSGTSQYGGFWLKEAVTTCARHCYATQLLGLYVCILRPKEEPVDLPFRKEFDPEHQNLYAALAGHHLSTSLVMVDRFDIMQRELCEVNRKVLANQLQSLSGAKNQHALLSMVGRGHKFYMAGNVGYIVKCAAREVVIAPGANCTQEIPVMDGKERRWVDAQTGILQSFGSPQACSGPMPIMFRLEGAWYCATPDIHACPAPAKLNTTVGRWDTHDFTEILEGGIFTQQQLDLHKAWDRAFSAREPILTKITNSVTGHQVAVGGDPHLGAILDTSDINDISAEVTGYLFPWIPQLGWISGHVGSAFLLIVAFQSLIGCLARIMAAYYRNGFGLHLLTASCLNVFLLVQIPWTLLGTIQRMGEEEADRLDDWMQPEAPPAPTEPPGPGPVVAVPSVIVAPAPVVATAPSVAIEMEEMDLRNRSPPKATQPPGLYMTQEVKNVISSLQDGKPRQD